ncbi:2-phosphosulfolactate phosphatase [Microbacterium sp. cx-55]|uniref:2-phosphosulfolactate phosphatase n=1 Tax=Microbacterium sp. cx-55 TaxID=2875948 RepID=UPI001CBE0670|nr:2-phosphosulfolactate phosphatase [Microbacterium sp. cx-55]MBZ4487602.1 2-phosphosulfolactate phosphatase [Microbacterium sp. cx-55]UGB35616.1 2-phosphosulfolactate phosphatase [Microbacterium sp. cx-55]
MPTAFDQSRYQIRVEWGVDGLARLAPSDVVVVVDVLTFSSQVTDAVAAGDGILLATGLAAGEEAASVAAAAAASGAHVLLGSLRNAAAVAKEALAEQQRRGARTSIAVIAVGERAGAATRFAVEDQLGAGAIIDALGALGIDHTSPEAAAACEAFRGLRAAVRHLLTASGSGQVLIEAGRRDDALAAAQVDATHVVPVLRDGIFVSV